MAITLKGSSVNYTISTPSTITINETNINTYFYNWKPTVTRNKTGTAATRYIVFSIGYNTDSYNIAAYKAVFAANSKTATVTAYTTPFGMAKYGDIANETFNRLYVGIATSTALSYFDSGYVSCGKTLNFSPTITLAVTKSQSSPEPGTFGYIKGICSATVTATIKKTWAYDGGSVTVGITNSSMSGGGKSASGVTGTSLTLDLGVLQSTSITVSATAKNSLGKTASATVTVSCDDYDIPIIADVSSIRNQSNEKNATITVDYDLHAINQRGTTGAIYVDWVIKSGDTTIASGTQNICASGTSLASLTGTCTISVTGSKLNVDTNYTVTLTVHDRVTTGNTLADIITSTFRLMHFGADGESIGIGGAAVPGVGLKVYNGLEADSVNGVSAVFGSYDYSGTSATKITFTDSQCIGKSHIICGCRDVGDVIEYAEIDPTSGQISVSFNSYISTATLDYICW